MLKSRRNFEGESSKEHSHSSTLSSKLIWSIMAAIVTVATLFVMNTPNQMQFTMDEGIYLAGATQVSQGLSPYVNFFALTGPGVYWLYGALFKVLGQSLTAAHLLLFTEIGLVSAVLTTFLMICTRSLSLTATIVGWFITVTTCTTYRLYINHRWDSMFCAITAAGCVLLSFQDQSRKILWITVAGFFAAAAVVITPTVATVPLVIATLLYVSPPKRKLVLPFTLGVSGSLLLASAVLIHAGALEGVLSAWNWNRHHYSTANRVWFGYFDIQARSIWSGLYFSAVLLSLAPTLTVVASLAVLASAKIKRQTVPDLVTLAGLVGSALLVAIYPRMAANQIAFAVPLFLVPLAWRISTASRVNQRIFIGSIATLACFLLFNLPSTAGTKELDTALGAVRCSAFDYAVLRNIQSHISPGQRILVYPYLPILYAVTGARPVSYYSYLQPGMMDALDEERVIKDCRSGSPSLIIWRRLEKEQMEGIWPSTDWAHAGFPRLEAYIQEHFHRLPAPRRLPVEYWVPN